jgi:hypothetical protein
MRQVYTAIIEDALDIARAQHPRGAAGVLAEAYVALRAERDALRLLLWDMASDPAIVHWSVRIDAALAERKP